MDVYQQLPIPLLNWYRDHARDLPWRRNPEPYAVWVSEIMLQQTRVSAVVDYYKRFMEELPTISALAEVPEDRLMKLWQGLGYYSRARNLQKAARQIQEQYGGIFPNSYEQIRALPGVGDYTAGAVASIAFGLPVPAVDGNVMRVIARLTGDSGDISTPAMKKKVTAALRDGILLDAPGRFNQALMELGALVCLPNGAPLCGQCPAAAFCRAFQEGRTDQLPVKKTKKPRRIELRNVYLLFYQGQVALRRRPAKGLLAGLWEFPHAMEGEPGLTQWGLGGLAPEPAGTARHIFSHIEWHMTGWTLRLEKPNLPEGWIWADAAALKQKYALPNAFQGFFCAVEAGLRQSAEESFDK